MSNGLTKTALLLLQLLWRIYSVSAQPQLNDSALLEKKFALQVKQLGQFIDRFNYSEVVLPEGGQQPNRFLNIASLVNRLDITLTHDTTTMQFIAYCSSDSAIQLHYSDSVWYSVVNCQFSYRGKPVWGKLILKPEKGETGGYNWIVIGVNLPFLNVKELHSTRSEFINPMNHEVGFSEITKAAMDGKSLVGFAAGDFVYDELSAFYCYVSNKDLVLNQVGDIEYHFYQLNGWFFIVRNFNRGGLNSGWLIAAIKRLSSSEKESLMRTNHIKK